MAEYVTIQGDTWDGICHKLYGNSRQMTELMQLNPDHLRVVIFSSGVRLRVPAETEAVDDELPPWKRVQ